MGRTTADLPEYIAPDSPQKHLKARLPGALKSHGDIGPELRWSLWGRWKEVQKSPKKMKMGSDDDNDPSAQKQVNGFRQNLGKNIVVQQPG